MSKAAAAMARKHGELGIGDLAAELYEDQSPDMANFLDRVTRGESVWVLVEEFTQSIRGLGEEEIQRKVLQLVAAFHLAANSPAVGTA